MVYITRQQVVEFPVGLGEIVYEKGGGGHTELLHTSEGVVEQVHILHVRGAVDQQGFPVLHGEDVGEGAVDRQQHGVGLALRLQELVQQNAGSSIRYEMTGESGPDHDKRFSCAVYINGKAAGEGEGRTKKEAEQAAAGSALERWRK